VARILSVSYFFRKKSLRILFRLEGGGPLFVEVFAPFPYKQGLFLIKPFLLICLG